MTHGDADVTFSVPLDDLPLMTNTIEGLCHDLGLHWRVDDTAAKVSLIGAGMKTIRASRRRCSRCSPSSGSTCG